MSRTEKLKLRTSNSLAILELKKKWILNLPMRTDPSFQMGPRKFYTLGAGEAGDGEALIKVSSPYSNHLPEGKEPWQTLNFI